MQENTPAPGTAPADDTIAAIRITLGILNGEQGPWTFPPTAIRGLALMLISAARANAELLGHATRQEQDAYVREWLDASHQAATLAALKHEAADG